MSRVYGSGHHQQRGLGLYNCIKDIVGKGIPGDYVECGVASGKSSFIAISSYMSMENDCSNRNFWLYDTYAGTNDQVAGWDRPHEEYDVSYTGVKAVDLWDNQSLKKNLEYLVSDEWVKEKMLQTGVLEEKLRIINGKVEDTISILDEKTRPATISMLRIDVDFYYPTKHVIENLYDLVAPGGYIFLDDYGHWMGFKKAIHEFEESRNLKFDITMVDYTGAFFIKR
jgi:hypothetical protein